MKGIMGEQLGTIGAKWGRIGQQRGRMRFLSITKSRFWAFLAVAATQLW